MSVQKILGVSLTTRERVGVSAAYDGTRLVLASIERYEGILKNWRNAAAERVTAAAEAGVSVFVEEMGEEVSQHAHGILLSDIHPLEGRTILSVALDWYFSMMNAEAIVFSPGTEVCRIPESSVDASTDDRGRPVYRPDWMRVKGAHRAMILCCLAAEGLQPVSAGYISELYGGLASPDGMPENPFARFRLANHEWDVQREREMQLAQRQQRSMN